MSKILIKTAESAVKVDKNGKNYKVVTLMESVLVKTPWGMKPKPASQCKSINVVCYESNINKKMDAGYAENTGDWLVGGIETRIVAPYEITSNGVTRKANTFSTVILEDTDTEGYSALVASSFGRKGHTIVTGNTIAPVAPIAAIAPSNAGETANVA